MVGAVKRFARSSFNLPSVIPKTRNLERSIDVRTRNMCFSIDKYVSDYDAGHICYPAELGP